MLLAFLKLKFCLDYICQAFPVFTCSDILLKRKKCHSFVSETGSMREAGWKRVSILAFRETQGNRSVYSSDARCGVRYLPWKNIWQYLEIFFIVRTIGEHDTHI